ncbi:MAG: hypothetical protein SNJ70_08950 [Armatimonadota bacterium]
MQVRGYADTNLRDPNNPTHFTNRRVSIVVAFDKLNPETKKNIDIFKKDDIQEKSNNETKKVKKTTKKDDLLESDDVTKQNTTNKNKFDIGIRPDLGKEKIDNEKKSSSQKESTKSSDSNIHKKVVDKTPVITVKPGQSAEEIKKAIKEQSSKSNH